MVERCHWGPSDAANDLALGHDQLLSKQSVFRDELRPRPNQIGGQSQHEPKKVDHCRSPSHPTAQIEFVASSAFLDGVNVASLSLMAVVTVQLARVALVDIPTLLLAIVVGVVLIRWKVNSTWLVVGAGLAGAVTHGLR
jgi:hypothetical protein